MRITFSSAGLACICLVFLAFGAAGHAQNTPAQTLRAQVEALDSDGMTFGPMLSLAEYAAQLDQLAIGAQQIKSMLVQYEAENGDVIKRANDMKALQRVIEAEIAQTPRTRDPQTWASLHVTLAILRTKAPDWAALYARALEPEPAPPKRGKRNEKTDVAEDGALAIEAMRQGYARLYAPAEAALDKALSIFSRDSSPSEWARAHAQRAYIQSSQTMFGGGDKGALDSARAAALSVYTPQGFPREYLELRCQTEGRYQQQMQGLNLADEAALERFSQDFSTNIYDVRSLLLSGACSGLDVPDRYNVERKGQGAEFRKYVIEVAGQGMLLEAGGAPLGPSAQSLKTLEASEIGFSGARGLRTNAYKKMKKDLEEEAEREAAQMREESNGRVIVNQLDQGRASYLNASLSLTAAGLSPGDQARARALRVKADQLALSAPSGPQWWANIEMWRTLAELYALLAAADYPPPSPPPEADVTVLAPVMLDKASGFVASKPSMAGQGALAAASLEWVKDVTANDLTQSMAEDMQITSDVYAKVGDALKPSIGSVVTGMIPVVNLFQQRAQMRAYQNNLERAQQEVQRRQKEAEATREQRSSSARSERATQGWSAAYADGAILDAIDDFRASFEPAWSPAFRAAATGGGATLGEKVLILPDGLASALPIGLLRDPRTGRTLIEDYELVYAPSLTAYASARQRAPIPRAESLAPVLMPRAESGLNVEPELLVAQAAFGADRKPLQPGASKADVLASLRGASYWHFATHGVFDQDNPRNSGLELGGGARLTLGDLLFAADPIGSPRLVILSACETGLFDAKHDPGEFIGLPSGFIQAGAAGVIASLWQVPDAPTTLLMMKFYRLHRGQGLRPSAALRAAQLWLKEATAAALTDYVNDLRAQGAIAPQDAIPMVSAILSIDAAQPFAHPAYWGAWVFYGA